MESKVSRQSRNGWWGSLQRVICVFKKKGFAVAIRHAWRENIVFKSVLSFCSSSIHTFFLKLVMLMSTHIHPSLGLQMLDLRIFDFMKNGYLYLFFYLWKFLQTKYALCHDAEEKLIASHYYCWVVYQRREPGSGDWLAHVQCWWVGSSVPECKLAPVSTRQPNKAVQLFTRARFKLSFVLSFMASWSLNQKRRWEKY
jgi:hypothetical protein